MFDIWKGWPYDGAINDNAEPLAGQAIEAGMAITKDVNGKLIKATGAEPTVYWAVEDQDAPPVVMAGVMPYIVKNAIILTDQYSALGTYDLTAPQLMVDAGTPGTVIDWDSNPAHAIVGYYEGTVERDSVTYMKIRTAD
jgi:hypothetical protein